MRERRLLVEIGRAAPDLLDVGESLVCPSELQKPRDRVQAIRELMLLGAQRLGETALAVEFAAQSLEVSTILHGHD